ncbi:13879_t:CDS:1, partial [Dentiscutata erythropus]
KFIFLGEELKTPHFYNATEKQYSEKLLSAHRPTEICLTRR